MEKTRRTGAKKTSSAKVAPRTAKPKVVRTPRTPRATGKEAAGRVAAPKGRRTATAAVPVPAPDAEAQRRSGAREVAKWVASAALDKKAERIEIIDIGEKVDYADYLVLMTGRSDRQVQSVAQGIEDALAAHGVRPVGVEGVAQGHWVLLDFADVIVHVFLEEARKYYDLEGLWMDARRVPLEASGRSPSVAPPEG